MVYMQDFRAKFISTYRAAREQHRDEWDAIWTDTRRWSGLMIYADDAVVRTVASQFGLKCYPREPLSLDAVFVRLDAPSWDWFPALVAIEHENNPRTFDDEVIKLLSIRCPLKVGITYVLSSDISSNPIKLCAKIATDIANRFNMIKEKVAEDAETQYFIPCRL